jgi:hypothetical protein
MWLGGQGHATTALPLGNRHGTQCIGVWVGTRAGLDGCGKYRPTGIRSPDLPYRTESLYRLLYTSPTDKQYEVKINGLSGNEYLYTRSKASERPRDKVRLLQIHCNAYKKFNKCRLKITFNIGFYTKQKHSPKPF